LKLDSPTKPKNSIIGKIISIIHFDNPIKSMPENTELYLSIALRAGQQAIGNS
jgi:hypothetical protein